MRLGLEDCGCIPHYHTFSNTATFPEHSHNSVDPLRWHLCRNSKLKGRGLMDKASDFGSEDCGFKSHRPWFFLFIIANTKNIDCSEFEIVTKFQFGITVGEWLLTTQHPINFTLNTTRQILPMLWLVGLGWVWGN